MGERDGEEGGLVAEGEGEGEGEGDGKGEGEGEGDCPLHDCVIVVCQKWFLVLLSLRREAPSVKAFAKCVFPCLSTKLACGAKHPM